MEIQEINNLQNHFKSKDYNQVYNTFNQLLSELKKRVIPNEVVEGINIEIEQINAISELSKKVTKQLLKSQSKVISLLETKVQIVPKKHYMKKWLVLGMSSLGIPIGVALSVAMNKIPIELPLGLPIGMLISIVIGSSADKKAAKENRQLNIEI